MVDNAEAGDAYTQPHVSLIGLDVRVRISGLWLDPLDYETWLVEAKFSHAAAPITWIHDAALSRGYCRTRR